MKCFLLLLFLTAHVIAQAQENTGGIQVQGVAQRLLPDDLAKFKITLQTSAGTSPEAQALLDPNVRELEILLKNLPEVKNVNILKSHSGQYKTSATLEVICNSSDAEAINLAFHKVAGSKPISFNPSPEIEPTLLTGPKLFSSSEQQARVKRELLQEATKNAEEQANILAATAKVTLGNLLSLKVLPEKTVASNSLNVEVEAKYAILSD